MAKKKTNNYISLQEATRYCEYSQEYLSLRARRGKLKAKKDGRNWVTKKEWLKDYITKVEGYKKSIAKSTKSKSNKKRIKNNLKSAREIKPIFDLPKYEKPLVFENNNESKKKYKEVLPSVTFQEKIPKKQFPQKTVQSLPPENLPVGEFKFGQARSRQHPVFHFGFVFGLVSVLIISGGIFGKTSLKNTFEDVSSFTYITGGTKDTITDETAEFVSQGLIVVSDNEADISKNISSILDVTWYVSKYTVNTFKEYFQWLGEEINKTPLYTYNKGQEGIQNVVHNLKKISTATISPFEDFYQFIAGLIIHPNKDFPKEKIFIEEEKLTTKTIRIERLEIVDKITGEVHCTWIEKGVWRETKGECD